MSRSRIFVSFSTSQPAELQKFQNGGFTLKTHQMLSIHATPEKLKNGTIIGHFRFVFVEN